MRSLLLVNLLTIPLLASGESQKSNISNPLRAYSDLAWVSYSQALSDAKNLDSAVREFARAPSLDKFTKARNAWLQSRESYGLTEAFRLAGGPVDAEEGWVFDLYGGLEGQINGWPLDEELIDVTIDSKGRKTEGSVISSQSKMFLPSGKGASSVDVRVITPLVLTELNENGSDANIASGYHAIEFLLWGQDQDYNSFAEDKITHGALKAGDRSWTDYTDTKLGKRRIAYLQSASSKLVNDLSRISSAWSPEEDWDCDSSGKGCYRNAILSQLTGKHASKNIKIDLGIRNIIKGLGVFIKSELANERIAVAVLTPSEEDEHSCFSDNTHRDITTNFQGFLNVLKGEYKGKSLGDSFYKRLSKEDSLKVDKLVSVISSEIEKMNKLAETKWHFDYQILPQNNAKGLKKMKNKMRKLGDSMVAVAKGFNMRLNKSDVTDAEETKI